MGRKGKPAAKKVQRADTHHVTAKRYITRLRTPSHDPGRDLAKLKREPWDVQRAVFAACDLDPRLRTLVLGNPFPAGIADLAAHAATAKPKQLSGIQDELNWALAIIRFFRAKAAAFLKHKQAYERALLSADYTTAQNVLAENREDVGYSLWYLEASLQLAEWSQGRSANRMLAKQYLMAAEDPLVKFFSVLLSLRAERASSLPFFESELRRVAGLEDIDRDAPELAFHIRFHLNRASIVEFRDEFLASNVARDFEYGLSDRVVNFINTIVVMLARTETSHFRWLLPLVTRAATLLDEPRLSAAQLLLTGNIAQDGQFDPLLSASIEAYTIGDYSTSADLARRGMLERPDWFDFYELFCASLPRLSVRPEMPLFQNTICNDMLRADQRETDAVRALGGLSKLAVELQDTRFGGRLSAWVGSRVAEVTPLDATRAEALNASMPTPRTALALESLPKSLAYLEELCRLGMTVTSELFIRALSGINEMPPGIPEDRALKYAGWAAERNGDFVGASVAYSKLLQISKLDRGMVHFAKQALFRSSLAVGELAASIDMAVDEVLRGESLFFPTQIPRLAALVPISGGEHLWKLIAWPILAYQAMWTSGASRDSHSVYSALDQFLGCHCVSRPSALSSIGDQFPRVQLVYLLQHVCIPDILDWSLDFSSPEDLDHERIAVLDWLEAIDPDNAGVYEEERAQVTRRIVLQKGLSQINRGKISVDTAGIRQELGPAFVEMAQRYISLRQNEDSLAEILPAFRVEGKRLFVLRVSDDGQVVVDDGTAMFRYLHDVLKNRFLWSDNFGLDSSLSVEIRHGAVSGQLRPPFERAALITQRDSNEGRYAPNELWLDLANSAPDNVRVQLDWVFASFSGKVDSIIEKVKDRWIRIRTSSEHPEGLFDFEYGVTDFEEARSRADRATDVNSLVMSLFDDLWQRTKRNLDSVRIAIRTRLADEFYVALATLEGDVQSICPELSAEIRRRVANCRIDLEAELSILEQWFAIDEVEAMSEYELPVLLETVLERVRRLPGIQDFSPIVEISGGVSLQGSTFRALYNVLYLIIQNVIEHAHDERNTATIYLRTDGLELAIEIANRIADTTDLPSLRTMAPLLAARAQGVGRTGLVRQEGKSGYFKLGKLLRSDLKRVQYAVEVELEADDQFKVSLRIPLEGLTA